MKSRKKSVKLEIESSYDELTGLYNRKVYSQNVLETIAYINRYNEPSSLMVCDIYFFKEINDSFGHKVGDLVLKKLSILLREKLRANEFISRYGGEEFAIIVPHAPLNEARKKSAKASEITSTSLFLLTRTSNYRLPSV